MINSYYKCESAGRFVTVWPSCTDEAGFYDVVFGDVDNQPAATTIVRLTALEAASYVITELGAPHRTTLVALEGMIRRWRDEYDIEMASAIG